MKRFVFHLHALLALNMLLFLACDAALGAWFVDGVALRYRDLVDTRKEVSYAVVGTSHAAYGINPRFMGAASPRFYNFAYASAGPAFYERWLPMFRRYRARLNLLVVEVDWFMFKPFMWRRLEHDSRYLPPREVLELVRTPGVKLPTLVMNRFPFFRLRKQVIYDFPMLNRPNPIYFQGYSPKPGRKSNLADGLEMQAFYHEPDRPELYAVFERLVREYKAMSDRVLFIQAPEYRPIAGSHKVENERFVALARRERIPFFNYNEERASAINTDPANYADWGHLSEHGCEAFSRRLHDDIEQAGLFNPPVH